MEEKGNNPQNGQMIKRNTMNFDNVTDLVDDVVINQNGEALVY